MSLLLAGAAINAVGQIYSGVTSMNAANETASDMRAQGDILFSEAERTANIILEEGYKFAASQALQYIGSGVELAGSALITIQQTKKYAEAEAAAVRSSGAAKRDVAYKGASARENEGRAALISGIVGAGSTMFSAAGNSKGAAPSATKKSKGTVSSSRGFYSAFDVAKERGSVY